MSRRLTASILSALLLAGLPATAIAQEEPAEPAPMWRTSVKKDASDVAAFGEGFVLVGGAHRKPVARIWLSEDGASWSRVPAQPRCEGVALRRVTASDDGRLNAWVGSRLGASTGSMVLTTRPERASVMAVRNSRESPRR